MGNCLMYYILVDLTIKFLFIINKYVTNSQSGTSYFWKSSRLFSQGKFWTQIAWPILLTGKCEIK